MNDHTQSPLTLGLVMLCAAMIIIMAIPFYLRSTVNKNIDVPDEEKTGKNITFFILIKFFMMFLLAIYLLLALSRVIHGSVIGDFFAIVLLVTLFVVGQKPKSKPKEDRS